MYNYNNKDKSKEEGLEEWWYLSDTTSIPHQRTTRSPIVNRVYKTLNKILKLFPTPTTKGESKYHK